MGRPDVRVTSDDLQFADLPRLLRDGDGDSLRALLLVAPEEDQSDDRLVPFLRRVESALCHPLVDIHRSRLVGGAMDGSGETRAHTQVVDADQRGRETGDARLF